MKLFVDEGLHLVEDYLKKKGLHPFLIVHQWNVHEVDAFLKQHPTGALFFTCHFNDVLPPVSLTSAATLLVPSVAHLELARAAGAAAERIQVAELFSAPPAGPLPRQQITDVVVIAEAHPYGGLVPALALLHECKKHGVRWNIYEHAIKSREIFLPVKDASPHSFPRRPSQASYAWREFVGVTEAPPLREWHDGTAFVWLPLHFAPPLSLDIAKIEAAGFPLLAMSSPWVSAQPQCLRFDPHMWSQFDPLRLPEESPLNTGIARGFAELILQMWR